MPISLNTRIPEYFRITPVQKAALKRLSINTIEDLLYHFPVRYGDTAKTKNIDSLEAGETAVIFGKVSGLKASKGWKSKVTMADGYVEDETGRIHCIWFNQPYLAKMIPEGSMVRIEGKVSQKRKKLNNPVSNKDVPAPPLLSANQISNSVPASISDAGVNRERAHNPEPNLNREHGDENQNTGGPLYFSNPKIEIVNQLPIGVGDSLFGDGNEAHTLYPVYPESRGISSSWIYHALQKVFKSGILDDIEEIIPEDILAKYHLPGVKTSLIWIHTPLNNDDALSARKRFSFEEIFLIQLGKKQARKKYEDHPSFLVETDLGNVQEFVRRFSFQATNSQTAAIESIISDMKKGQAMSRLLEGDVGSGKTAVAAAAAYAVMVSKPRPVELKNDPESESAQTKKKRIKSGTESAETAGLPPRVADSNSIAAVPNPTGAVTNSINENCPANSLRAGNLQIAYMCPTEILAIQHFESFIKYFSYMPIQIGLITGSGCRKFPSKINPKGWTDISRTQLLQWVENGEIAVLVGTHALIQKTVQFKNLALAIIDEQHRFGTAQRAKLVKKNRWINESLRGSEAPSDEVAPHLLSMTATPIPRTLALTMYGDLDLTLLSESPAGRKPIITELVLPGKRDGVYEKIRQELKAGRQMYVICPRINEPDPDKQDALIAKSVKEEAKRLKKSVFQEYEIGVLHGKMKPHDKDLVMNDFRSGKINILCATSVIEVGVNVENATIIIIEGAERFGLAQLHQLRGRVMRSSLQAYCYVFTETNSAKSIGRLKALQSSKNGFELAELDLSLRGAGELSGGQQWGVSDIAMEALRNIKMVEAAREEATRLIEEDVDLNEYPLLKKSLDAHLLKAHFE